MKKLFELAERKGYKVHNKRVLSDHSEYTSDETRRRDSVQEMALLQMWLRDNHNLYLWVKPFLDEMQGFVMHEGDFTDTPIGIDYNKAWASSLESALNIIH